MAQVGRAGLPLAGELALAAHAQVELGQLEPARVLAQGLEPLEPALGRLGRLEQEAVRLVGAATDPAAQLVQLGEAEAVGVLDDDRRRVRDVDAHLDHGRRDQHLRLARREGLHGGGLLRRGEPSVHEADAQRLELAHEVLVLVLGRARLHGLRALDERADHVGLAPVLAPLLLEPDVAVVALAVGHAVGRDRTPAGRHVAQLGDVEIAVQPERERARDRRRRHVQRVRPVRLGEAGALLDAEAVLLVDHRHEQTVELDPALEQRVRADGHRGIAGGEPLQPHPALRGRDLARDQLDREADRLEQRAQRGGVLLGERLRRRHQRALAAGLDRPHERVRGDDGLARADVAEQQPAHRARAAQVAVELADHPSLPAR